MGWAIDPVAEGFESGLGNWSAHSAQTSVSLTSGGIGGTQCMEIMKVASGVGAAPRAEVNPSVPIVGTHPIDGGPFGKVVVRGWYYLAVANIQLASVYIIIYDADMNQVAFSSGPEFAVTGVWTQLTIESVLPADADTISVWAAGETFGPVIPVGAYLLWDDFEYEGHTLEEEVSSIPLRKRQLTSRAFTIRRGRQYTP